MWLEGTRSWECYHTIPYRKSAYSSFRTYAPRAKPGDLRPSEAETSSRRHSADGATRLAWARPPLVSRQLGFTFARTRKRAPLSRKFAKRAALAQARDIVSAAAFQAAPKLVLAKPQRAMVVLVVIRIDTKPKARTVFLVIPSTF